VTIHDRLGGIFPPIPTTFDPATGDVAPGAIRANVERWMRTALAGVLAIGSNGEAPTLDDDEVDRVVAAAREAVPRQKTLLVGIGRESTRGTVTGARRAAALGADAVLVRAPFYYRTQMTPDVLTAHFTAVADASPVPVLLYNLPAVTGLTISVAMVRTLSAHPNIVGIKETSPELERLGQFAAMAPGRFSVLSGSAPVIYPALVSGAVGGILAVANVLPDELAALHGHAGAGRHADALALQRRVTPLAQLVTSGHGIAGLKAALDLTGYHGGPVRSPLTPVTPAVRDDISRAIALARGA
jgi:4-hydroxy-2-oxoglutarate aldolase